LRRKKIKEGSDGVAEGGDQDEDDVELSMDEEEDASMERKKSKKSKKSKKNKKDKKGKKKRKKGQEEEGRSPAPNRSSKRGRGGGDELPSRQSGVDKAQAAALANMKAAQKLGAGRGRAFDVDATEEQDEVAGREKLAAAREEAKKVKGGIEVEDDDYMDDDDDEVHKPSSKRKKPSKKTAKPQKTSLPPRKESNRKERSIKSGKSGPMSPLSVDSSLGLGPSWHVQEQRGTVFASMLNQVDIAFGVKGHNKFYFIQLLTNDTAWNLLTKWGRVSLNYLAS
jgi:hypothetical protein